MALVNKVVSKSLQDFLLSLHEDPDDETKAKIKAYADGFSSWVIDTIKSATVTVAPGIAVSTTGTAVAQTGSTTGSGQGSIS